MDETYQFAHDNVFILQEIQDQVNAYQFVHTDGLRHSAGAAIQNPSRFLTLQTLGYKIKNHSVVNKLASCRFGLDGETQLCTNHSVGQLQNYPPSISTGVACLISARTRSPTEM